MIRKQFTLLLAVSLLAMALLSAFASQVQGQTTVNITFNATGYTRYDQQFYVIDGTSYGYWNPAPTFQWIPGSSHTVAAVTPISNWDSVTYKFGSWTNGNGLTTSSGSFITPTTDTAVTLNYVKSTYTAHFAIGGTTNVDTGVLKIDGTTYTLSALPTTPFYWEKGTTHSVEALGPVYSWDTPPRGFNFSSWTNGNGLTTNSGTFTMPAQDVTVTANYVQSTVQVVFRHTGLTNPNDWTVLTIDGVSYNYWQVEQSNFQMMKGSTHTVTAATPLTGYDGGAHYFNGWTNGNGLTITSTTFTVPNSDVVVTANYGLTQPITQQATSITINCAAMNENRVTTIQGTLTSGGSGVVGKTVTLSYFNGASWCPIALTTTTAGGAYTYDWTVPAIVNGVYPVKAEFAEDSSYLGSSAITGSTGNGPSLQVLPESWSSVVALLACFGGALVFFKVRAKRSNTKAANL